MRKRLPVYVTAFLFSSLLAACSLAQHQRQAAVLADVETYVNEKPDSALIVLRGLDSMVTRSSPALQARFSLLHTMALDKCYSDITAPGLLDPAIKWFTRFGSADEKMKTLYYQGRIAQDKGEVEAAAVFYSKATSFARDAQDSHAKALLYLAFGSLYNSVYDYQKELTYKQTGLSILQEAGDPLYESARGELALVYHSMEEWEIADSLYREAIASAFSPRAKALYLSNYARMKVLQPHPEPAETIRLLNQKVKEHSGSMSPAEAGAYAYALELLGNTSAAESILLQLDALQPDQRHASLPWLYRIEKHRKNSSKALDYLEEAWVAEKTSIEQALSDKVSSALEEYYDSLAAQERRDKQLVIRSAGCVIMLLVAFCLLFLVQRIRIASERDRLLEIRSAVTAEMNLLEKRVSEMSESIISASDKLEHERWNHARKLAILQDQYNRERLLRFRQLGRMGSTVWQKEHKRVGDAAAWKELKDNIFFIHQLQKGGVELVRFLDKELDGVIGRMRRDLNLRGKPKEVLFLCCCIMDIDPVVISDALSISVDNVYKKRSRYRAQIERLGNTEYLQLLNRKLLNDPK